MDSALTTELSRAKSIGCSVWEMEGLWARTTAHPTSAPTKQHVHHDYRPPLGFEVFQELGGPAPDSQQGRCQQDYCQHRHYGPVERHDARQSHDPHQEAEQQICPSGFEKAYPP